MSWIYDGKVHRLIRFEETPKRSFMLDVLIPSSITKEVPHLREKTFRLGLIARFLAIFRVDRLVIYHEDEKDSANARFIKDVMDYLNTAPYLRKRLFPLKPTLRYAGLLPPLNIPIHPESTDMLERHFRDALVVSSGRRTLVDAGLGKPIKVRKKLKEDTRVIVEVLEKGSKFKVISRHRSPVYPGFKTIIVEDKNLKDIATSYDLRIATSRYGRPFHEVLGSLKERILSTKKVCIAFGSAKRGLYEIASLQGFKLEEAFDYVLNAVPYQGVRTIRTEEAIGISLSLISLIEFI